MNEAFWTFSLRFYQLPGVAESCIELQDRHGADVNLVLFALWAAASGHQLDAEAIAAADRAARQWRETVTQPLRAARRALKTCDSSKRSGLVFSARRAARSGCVTVSRHCLAARSTAAIASASS